MSTARRSISSPRSRLGLAAVAVAVAVSVLATLHASSSGQAAPPVKGLHVAGNRLLGANNQDVVFHGVNRSGTEYSCIHGAGIFDGPSDAGSVAAIASWHVNVVRIGLNEDCWLGINGAPSQYSGSAYRSAIVNYVLLLHRHGMYAELSLMWAGPGTAQATYQPNAPDEDHAPATWASMARTFRNDPNVVLAPWGETTVAPDCFLHGCNGAAWATNRDGLSSCRPGCWYYKAAGMQQAVDVMRHAGYRGVIAIPGVQYANDLSHWLQYEPKDPMHQLIAEAHVYGKNTCDTDGCFQSTLVPVARHVPLIFGETGESYDASDCGAGSISTILGWADKHHVGYEAWAWDAWPTCSALIRDYAGTPHAAYGAWIKAHYAANPAQRLGAA